MNNIKTYKVTIRKGALGDWGQEYWTEEDWENHRKNVEYLKSIGEYLKEEEITIHLKSLPQFDKVQEESKISANFYILDLNK